MDQTRVLDQSLDQALEEMLDLSLALVDCMEQEAVLDLDMDPKVGLEMDWILVLETSVLVEVVLAARWDNCLIEHVYFNFEINSVIANFHL